jgi:aspartate 4-decarboxylase
LINTDTATPWETIMDVVRCEQYEGLSPFEIKDFLAKAALKTTMPRRSPTSTPDAATRTGSRPPRARRSSLLGHFASDRKQAGDGPAAGHWRHAEGTGHSQGDCLAGSANAALPGAAFLARMLPWTMQHFGFDADKFVHELVDSIIGDNYPVPDRMLVHNEQIVHEYLQWAMCGEPAPKGKFNIYAVEGGTAAMCYIFKTMKSNRLLNPGDTIALGRADLHALSRNAASRGLRAQHRRHPRDPGERVPVHDEELDKLLTRRSRRSSWSTRAIRAPLHCLSDKTIAKIGQILEKRPDLILLTDDVYGTFVPGFRGLLGAFPHNTIGVYSYSKYFGCTGWRLGTIAVHEDNVFDKLIAAHPEPTLKWLWTSAMRAHADAAQAALHRPDCGRQPRRGAEPHRRPVAAAAGDDDAVLIVRTDGRKEGLPEGLHRHRQAAGPRHHRGARDRGRAERHFDYYYGLIDFEFWMRKYIGDDVVEVGEEERASARPGVRLAEDHGIVLLNGSGFDAPAWSVRVSFANLPEHVYDDIGRALRSCGGGLCSRLRGQQGKFVDLTGRRRQCA